MTVPAEQETPTQEVPQAVSTPVQSEPQAANDFSAKVAALDDTADTTAEFDANDIAQNKAMDKFKILK